VIPDGFPKLGELSDSDCPGVAVVGIAEKG